jgi:hypothetical protein
LLLHWNVLQSNRRENSGNTEYLLFSNKQLLVVVQNKSEPNLGSRVKVGTIFYMKRAHSGSNTKTEKKR